MHIVVKYHQWSVSHGWYTARLYRWKIAGLPFWEIALATGKTPQDAVASVKKRYLSKDRSPAIHTEEWGGYE